MKIPEETARAVGENIVRALENPTLSVRERQRLMKRFCHVGPEAIRALVHTNRAQARKIERLRAAVRALKARKPRLP